MLCRVDGSGLVYEVYVDRDPLSQPGIEVYGDIDCRHKWQDLLLTKFRLTPVWWPRDLMTGIVLPVWFTLVWVRWEVLVSLVTLRSSLRRSPQSGDSRPLRHTTHLSFSFALSLSVVRHHTWTGPGTATHLSPSSYLTSPRVRSSSHAISESKRGFWQMKSRRVIFSL